MTTLVKALAAGSIAAIALLATSASAEQGKKLTPTEAACACLTKISVTHEGKTFHLKEGTHFRKFDGSGHPDEVLAAGVSLRAGLREHRLWKARVSEMETCLKLIPGLKYVGRSDK